MRVFHKRSINRVKLCLRVDQPFLTYGKCTSCSLKILRKSRLTRTRSFTSSNLPSTAKNKAVTLEEHNSSSFYWLLIVRSGGFSPDSLRERDRWFVLADGRTFHEFWIHCSEQAEILLEYCLTIFRGPTGVVVPDAGGLKFRECLRSKLKRFRTALRAPVPVFLKHELLFRWILHACFANDLLRFDFMCDGENILDMYG